jgi:hypothetical protein
MPKFKIVKVHSFRISNKRYRKGETIELSEEDAKRLKGADFLEPIQEPKPENLKKQKKRAENFPFFFL